MFYFSDKLAGHIINLWQNRLDNKTAQSGSTNQEARYFCDLGIEDLASRTKTVGTKNQKRIIPMNYVHLRIALKLLKAFAKLLVLLVAFPVVILLLFEGVTLILTDKIPAVFRKLSSDHV